MEPIRAKLQPCGLRERHPHDKGTIEELAGKVDPQALNGV